MLKAKAYYPGAQSFERIEESEESFNEVCDDFARRGFIVVECDDDWQDIGEDG